MNLHVGCPDYPRPKLYTTILKNAVGRRFYKSGNE